MGIAYLSLGSNLDPERHLRAAAAALRERFAAVQISAVKFSPVYRVPAVGFEGPDFLNAAAVLDSDLDPFALDAWLHELEDEQGRRRDVPRFSSRTLDLDLVFYDDIVLKGPGHLELPRPELRHAFVLKPLVDVASDFRDPRTQRTLAELWAAHPEYATPPTRIELLL